MSSGAFSRRRGWRQSARAFRHSRTQEARWTSPATSGPADTVWRVFDGSLSELSVGVKPANAWAPFTNQCTLGDYSFSNGIEHDLGRVMQIELLHQIRSMRLDR